MPTVTTSQSGINNSTAFIHESSRCDIRVGQNVSRWSGISNATVLFSSSLKRSLEALKYSGGFSGEKPSVHGATSDKIHKMHFQGVVRDG